MTHNPLNHHEELRYQYLLRNLQYLNAREQEEFNYLNNQKIQARQTAQEAFWAAGQEEQNDEDSYYADGQSSYDQEEWLEAYDGEDYTEQGLLRYPEKSSHRQEVPSTAYQEEFLEPEIHYHPAGQDQLDQDELLYLASLAQESQQASRAKQSKALRKNWLKAFKKDKSNSEKPKTSLKVKLKRTGQVLLVLLLFTFIGMLVLFGYGYLKAQSYEPAQEQVFNGQKTSDGTNILILGSDKRITQGTTDARTDTIMVVNIGGSDGKVKMVSFMRDTLVNIEGASSSPYVNDHKLNAAFSLGEQDGNQGAELMRQTLKSNFDIDIEYYMMIDFETFAGAVDTLFPGGVEIDAQFSTVDGQQVSSVQVPDDLNLQPDGTLPEQTIEVGKQKMDGRTLLNYARFRKDDQGDYGRTLRQQQVMSALLSQAKNPMTLFTGSVALGKVYGLVSTNLTFLSGLGQGIKSLGGGVERVTIPAQGDWLDSYDIYGGQSLEIDFLKYQQELSNLGLR